MSKQIEKLLSKVIAKRNVYRNALGKAEEKVREVCDFNARLVDLDGDGLMILDEDTTNVCSSCHVVGHTESNPFTEEEHEKFSK